MFKPLNRTQSVKQCNPRSKLSKELKIEVQESQVENFLGLGKNSPQGVFDCRPPLQPLEISENCTQSSLDPKITQSPKSYIFKTHNHQAFFSSKSAHTLHSKLPIQRSQQAAQNKLSQVVTSVTASSQDLYQSHLQQTFQTLKFISALRHPTSLELIKKQVYLPKRPGYQQKRTLILDLDQTLVHCVENPYLADIQIFISFPSGEQVQAGINIRPYAQELLTSANKDFEVIVFTASHQCYADKVLDFLDPTRRLIHHRLYREHCLNIDGVNIKDLRIFSNRRVEDIVIVDNAAYSFAYQLDNGIPIISWYEDRYDRELFKLIDYLKVLARVVDIRNVNR